VPFSVSPPSVPEIVDLIVLPEDVSAVDPTSSMRGAKLFMTVVPTA
jgi:hypothetical protein